MLKTIAIQMVSPQVYPEGHYVLRFILRVIMFIARIYKGRVIFGNFRQKNQLIGY